MLFNQKINALAMLGSVDDIQDISGPLQSKGINLLKKNFVSTEDLISAIRKEKNVEYIFLSDSGMLGVRDGIYTVPVELSSLEKDLYIVIFFNLGKYNKDYLRWAAGYGIQSVYFINDPQYTDEGAFDFNKILKEVKEKKRIYTEQVVPAETEEAPKGAPKVIKVEVEKEKVVEVPVERIVEREVIKEVPVEKIIEKEVIREVPVEKVIEKEVIIKVPAEDTRRSLFGKAKTIPTKRQTTIIGVYGSSSGAGATSLCIDFGKYLSAKSHTVAILERNKKPHLTCHKEKGIDISSASLNELDISNYDYIFLDFGVLYELSRQEPYFITDSREEIQKCQQIYGIERKYCTNTIMVCPTAPWRIPESNFFLNDMASDNTKEWIFYFNGNPDSKEFNKLMKSHYEESRMVISYDNKKSLDQLYGIINMK